MFMGAAATSPIIHHIVSNKLIFDMSMPVRIVEPNWNQLNSITLKYSVPALSVPALSDYIFRPSPLFEALKSKIRSRAYGSPIIYPELDEPGGVIFHV